jgi:hypothetical protein
MELVNDLITTIERRDVLHAIMLAFHKLLAEKTTLNGLELHK